jgi:enoyl-CoA hydratase/carnithine racemase
MDDHPVIVERRDRVARVRLANPARRNPLGREIIRLLTAELAAIGADHEVAVVVLSAEGPAFSAGHDVREMLDRDEDTYRDLFSACSELMFLLRSLAQPVIAVVDGVATAAGCQLVAGCDLAVATDTSTFATPGVKIGLFCSTPLVPISRAVGPKRSMEMLLTGTPIDAATALTWGLVNRVVPRDRLDATVAELVDAIVAASPTVVALGKSAYYHQAGLSEQSAYEVMTEIMTANAMLPDAQEGMRAFVEKRAPRWGA